MIDMHIRPGEVLRCESRPPRRELGLLRWSLAATIVLAAALDALWLVPTPPARSLTPSPSYSEMHRRHCRRFHVERELAAARVRVEALQAEADALDLAEANSHAVEVTLVRVPQ